MFDVYNFVAKIRKIHLTCKLFAGYLYGFIYIYLTCKHFAGYYLGQRYDLWFG